MSKLYVKYRVLSIIIVFYALLIPTIMEKNNDNEKKVSI